jgi:hypothetical protein
MNKTIEQHFYDSMPADIAAMAIRNTDEDLLHMSICQTPAAALQKAFDWAASDQGYAFWSSVFDTVSESRDFRDLKVSEYDLAMAGLKKLHAELVKDKQRLDWLCGRMGEYSINGIGTREKIDAAMNEEWYDRERHDKIMSGMDAED